MVHFLNKFGLFPLKQSIKGFNVIKELGEGRFGICYLVEKDNNQFVLKKLKKNILSKYGEKVRYETEILGSIEHGSIPKLIQRIDDEKFIGYLFEFKEGLAFEEIIFEGKHTFSKEEIYNIGMQIVDILKYLHNQNILHRDIRIPNVIYDDGRVYLIDFGLSRWNDNEKYSVKEDFYYLGDFLIHLHYTSFEKSDKPRPWYEELDLFDEELRFLKKLMELEGPYKNVKQVEYDLLRLIDSVNNKSV